ncbi:MAG: murein biosynthesis integral membrane protein MurJ [Micrococcales bacterium]|nr:murein biosynthesis integral membrane protein MurJ [Micrococcales bacterium]
MSWPAGPFDRRVEDQNQTQKMPPVGSPVGPGGPGPSQPDGPSTDRPGSVRGGAAVMALGTAVSRVLGQARAAVLIWVIGAATIASDAFELANSLPTVLYNLLVSGALSAVLVPQVVRAYKRNAGQEYVDRLLTLGFVVLAVLTVTLTAAVPLLVMLYGRGGGDPTRLNLAIAFGFWTLPQIFFYGMYALIGQVLNARGSFGPYMWAPVANNIVSIATMGLFLWQNHEFSTAIRAAAPGGPVEPTTWTGSQVALLAGGATLGIVAQALVLLPAMRRAGVRYRPRWGFRGVGLRTAANVALWTFVALAIGQAGTIAVGQLAGAARDAGVPGVAGRAAYAYAFMIFMLPHSLVTVSLLTALFPRLSSQAADHAHKEVARTFSQGARVVGLFTVLAGTLGILLSGPLVQAVLPSIGSAVEPTARVVVAFMVGLPAFGVWSACQRVYYAYEDARGLVPVAVGAAAVVLLSTGAVWLLGRAGWLSPHLWVFGAALAMSASYLLSTGMALAGMKVRIGTIGGGALLRTYLRATLAVVVAAGAGWVVLVAASKVGLVGPVSLVTLVEGSGLRGWLVAVGLCLVVGSVVSGVYLVVLKLLRVPELDLLIGSVRNLVRRLKRR